MAIRAKLTQHNCVTCTEYANCTGFLWYTVINLRLNACGFSFYAVPTSSSGVNMTQDQNSTKTGPILPQPVLFWPSFRHLHHTYLIENESCHFEHLSMAPAVVITTTSSEDKLGIMIIFSFRYWWVWIFPVQKWLHHFVITYAIVALVTLKIGGCHNANFFRQWRYHRLP